MSSQDRQHRHALVRSSINIDETFAVSAIVRPGQTIASKGYQARAGGKGANVAAAIGLALHGHEEEASVQLVGAVGKDASWPVETLAKCNVDVSGVSILEDVPTGRAFIQVGDDGENSIVLLQGANGTRTLDDADRILNTRSWGRPHASVGPTHLVLQNEIPLETTRAFLKAAETRSITTIFNPSPLPTEAEAREFEWDLVDVLVVNEGEAGALVSLFGANDVHAPSMEEKLVRCPKIERIRWIIVTRGDRGVSAYVRQGDGPQRETIDQAAFKPEQVIDTTGAGDIFLGYLVAGLLMYGGDANLPATTPDIEQILRFAAYAASMAVGQRGALESCPNGAEVMQRSGADLGRLWS
ncbi:unnamed protein product [Tilletia controversa]|uniref:Ribokinase n=3 Tax=Tilletia TaxID=13289 RepID=A0A8X7SXY4_9BASI|nr:hypothetical protein CF336_g2561 [Tilletia laevis]KAE8202149.1 hypothetical protein CF328_g2384 [Tilletia controversa]KAE8262974.1 hypothetical protein A4X03_0g2033 [Tilletia caries]KAE8206614.1 hypothetical protein CF335_g1755 [Tilletia laevis]KAE8249768.1 hypothetical protein A4X06_0g3079 [Tilletia controversa]